MSNRANYSDRLGDYVEVKDRLKLFYERHPEGSVVTDEVRATDEPDGTPRVWVKAKAYRAPDDEHPGVGWSWMVLPGSTPYTKGSELENTETSAWGRAIGALGIGIDKSIASGDEVRVKAGESDRPERESTTTHDGGLIGTAEAGKGQADFELRQSPDGPVLAFRLVQGRKGYKVIAFGDLAGALATLRPSVEGQRVTVWGTFHDESFDKVEGGQTKTITYQVVHLERIATPDGVLPASLDSAPAAVEEPSGAEPIAPGQVGLDLDAEERALVGGGLPG